MVHTLNYSRSELVQVRQRGTTRSHTPERLHLPQRGLMRPATAGDTVAFL